MGDPRADARLRVDAAKALMPFVHARLAAGGKKDGQKRAAEDAERGKYASVPPPLRVIPKEAPPMNCGRPATRPC